jgi:hypothetical protein
MITENRCWPWKGMAALWTARGHWLIRHISRSDTTQTTNNESDSLRISQRRSNWPTHTVCGQRLSNWPTHTVCGQLEAIQLTHTHVLRTCSTGHIWTCKVIVKDYSTIIINVTPSLWSRPGSSHEDLSMHANTHVHTHVFLLFGPEFQDGGC